MIGEAIGNFTVVSKLGRGAMGEVYLAEQKNIGTRVAIKALLPHVSADKDHVQRFFNEAIAVSRIKHAGTAKIFDVGFTASGQAYLIMEFLEGESLARRIEQRGRLAPVELAEIGRQISSVLEATHQGGIIHRDLKPDNIFVVPDNEMTIGERVKVLDFGIAKLGGAALTGTSMTAMGTPNYMAPEQWHNVKKVDWRADAYSLGCVLFEMAAGRVPFPADSLAEACTKHLTVKPPRLRELVSELPSELELLVGTLLEKDPRDRPSSMNEVTQTLVRIGQASSSAAIASPAIGANGMLGSADPIATTLPADATTGRAAQAPRRRRWAIALGAVSLGAASVVAALAVGNRSATEPKPTASDRVQPTVTEETTTADAAVAVVPVDSAPVISTQLTITPSKQTATPTNSASGAAWKPFVRTEGAFSVLLPGTPKESTADLRILSKTITAHRFELAVAPDVDYVVTYSEVDPSYSIDVDAFLEATMATIASELNGELSQQAKKKWDGAPGIEAQIKSATGATIAARVIVADGFVYGLLVGDATKGSGRANVAKFFDSFHRTKVVTAGGTSLKEGAKSDQLTGEAITRLDPNGTVIVPTLTLGEISTQGFGALDKAIIRRYIKRNLSKISYCYIKVQKPGLAGTVQTQFLIQSDGRVGTSRATGVDPEIAACIADAIRGIEFPKPAGDGDVQVNYPMTLGAAR